MQRTVAASQHELPEDLEEVFRLRRGTMLQEAAEEGAVSQCEMDSGCVVEVMHLVVPVKPMLVVGRLDRGPTRSGRGSKGMPP